MVSKKKSLLAWRVKFRVIITNECSYASKIFNDGRYESWVLVVLLVVVCM